MKTPFFGPSYISRSSNLADCQCVNLYPEVVETKQGKEIGALYLTPGLTLLATVGSGPIRGLHVGGQKLSGTLFAASGNQLYVVDSDFNSSLVGSIGSAFNVSSVPMIDNGFQLAAFSGNQGFVYNNGALSAITLPFSAQPISATYQDGFGLINQAGSALQWQSNLNDLTTWDPLDFASGDTYPDDVVALVASRREIYVIKRNDTEIWYNVGTPGFTFARNQGTLIEHGTCAPNSVAKSGDNILWLEQNEEGLGIVIEVAGYNARRVSTHGLETLWATYPTLSDAIGYSYQLAGHSFYVLTFPSGDATWVYDRTDSALLGIPLWHRWAAADSDGVFHRHPSNAFAVFNGIQIVGDATNGNLYRLDLDQLLDYQSSRIWLRSWRALPQSSLVPLKFPPLAIDMETGITVLETQDYPYSGPLMSLKWSDDGGHTWSNAQFASAGRSGQTAKRVIFRRIGSTRRGSGLDRIFQISNAATYQAKFIGAELIEQ